MRKNIFLLKVVMKKGKIKVIKNIEQIKKDMDTAEQCLLIRHNKNVNKYLKDFVDNKRKLTSYINDSN